VARGDKLRDRVHTLPTAAAEQRRNAEAQARRLDQQAADLAELANLQLRVQGLQVRLLPCC